ncbi:MAG: NAD-dependent deacylase [Acidobacteria bacterium]|nr:NAD-dependent deacylase [Acidobacteriota bacterium]
MDEARRWLRAARRVAVLTGAGISAESGIPTFRGQGGLWRQYRPEDLATPEAFDADPKLVWEWYNWRRSLIAKAQPNPGHRALAQLEERVPEFCLITQNVDGLHERAGSRMVVRLHGDIWTLRCTHCGLSCKNEDPELGELPPRCACGGLQRPGVVWFGENLPAECWQTAEKASRAAEVFLVVGTSAVVMPAAGLAAVAKNAGARVIEVNADDTPLSGWVDASLRGPAGKILPELLAA